MTSLAHKVYSPVSRETTRASALSILQKLLHAGARVLFGKLLPRLPYPVLRGPLRGCRYVLGATAGEAGGISVHFGLQEVEQTRCLAGLLRPGQTFVDVGANVGFYSLLASRLVGATGTVVAFEPMPRNIALLHRHVALNNAKNITIVPAACANCTSVDLFCAGENDALGHLAGANGEKESGPAVSRPSIVATLSLDEAAETLGIVPDVVKIDVEGAELRVLAGAHGILTRSRPVLLLSVHSDQLRDQCLAHLQRLGYELEPLNASSRDAATEFVAKSRR